MSTGDGYGGMELSAALAIEQSLARHNRKLTEAEKEKIMNLCKDARTEEEVDQIITENVPFDEMYQFK